MTHLEDLPPQKRSSNTSNRNRKSDIERTTIMPKRRIFIRPLRSTKAIQNIKLTTFMLSIYLCCLRILVISCFAQASTLRQVLIPVLGGQSQNDLIADQSTETTGTILSPNNRGLKPPDGFSPRFGERIESLEGAGKKRQLLEGRGLRRNDAASAIVWSQPDPRKMYSLPLTLPVIKSILPPRGEAPVHKRPVLLQTARFSGNKLQRVGGNAPEDQNPPVTKNETTFELGSLETEQSSAAEVDAETQPPESGQRKSSTNVHQQPVVTLIRYVPVLMSIPAEQLATLPPARSRAQYVLVKPSQASGEASHELAAPVQYAPTINNQATRHQVSAESSGVAPAFEFDPDSYATHYTQPVAAGNNNQQQQQQIYVPPAQIIANQAQSSKQALSAYASRLMSMFRPSSLLSNIAPASPPIMSQSYSAQKQPPLVYSMIPSQPAQIYLLPLPPAAAPTGQVQSARLQSVGAGVKRPGRTQANIDELQAGTRLHASATRFPYWSHQHPNGLICVHGQRAALLLSDSGPQTITKGLEQVTTSLPLIEQQQQQQRTIDQGSPSFEYAAEGTGIEGPKQRGFGKTSGQLPVTYSKESPVKVAQKIYNKKQQHNQKHQQKNMRVNSNGQTTHDSLNEYSKDVQQQQISVGDDSTSFGDPETWPGGQNQQQSLSTKASLESRSALAASATITASDESSKDNATDTLNAPKQIAADHQPRANEQRYRYGNGSQSIIPFTIKDKIELPAGQRRRSYQQQHPLSSSPSPGKAHLHTTGYRVQYDEPPADHELELPTPAPSSFGGVNKPSLSNANDRRSKTTFVSTPASRAGGGSISASNIDYSREAAPANNFNSSDPTGYTLPLLMASSATARERRIEPTKPQQDAPTTSREPPAFLRPSVIFRSPTDLPLSAASHESMGAAASSTNDVTTPASNQLESEDGDRTQQLSPSRRLLQKSPVPPPQRARTSPTTANTVELVVDSSAEPTAASAVKPAKAAGDQRGGSQKIDINNSTLNAQLSGEQSSRRENKTDDGPANHLAQAHENNAFSAHTFSAPISGEGAGGGEEFGRISEALQTNPLDLADLQNARSSFELPTQLESLSMLFTSQQQSPRPAASEAELGRRSESRPVVGFLAKRKGKAQSRQRRRLKKDAATAASLEKIVSARVQS